MSPVKKNPKKTSPTKTSVVKRQKSSSKGETKSPETPRVIQPEIMDSAPHDELDHDKIADFDDSIDLHQGELNADDAEDILIKAISSRKKKKADSSTALTTLDPINAYLAELKKYPLLTKEEEQILARRYREHNDSKAAEQLVTSNLRFVVKVAAEYSKFGAKLIDLIQEGNVGLMHAVKEFNPYKGVRLITYAVWWIRGYIQEYLMRQYSMVRIGTTANQRKLFYRLQKEKERLDAMGKEPNHALLSSRLGVTEQEVLDMTNRMSGRDVSLNQPIGDDGKSSLLDFESNDDIGVDDKIGRSEELQILLENIEGLREGLNPKETYILEKRLLSDEPMTLQEIGDHYGTTREAVRQLEARLMAKIKTAFEEAHVNKMKD